MEFELSVIILLCCAFFAAGFIDSIAGGGGLIAVPVFLLTGVPPELALGTNKLVSSLGTTASLMTYAKSGLVLWRMALAGLPAAIIGGFLGTKAVLLFDSASIGKIVVFLLPLGVLATLFPKKELQQAKALTPKALYVYCPLVCLILGFYDGFVGPGTGSFFILAFHFIIGIGLVHASATAKVFNLTTGIGSLVAFAWHGDVLYMLGIPLAIANIAGNIIGSKLVIKIGPQVIRKILMVSLTILFISLAWKFFS